MNVEELRAYCMAKAGVTEEFPFDNDTLAFKVMDKIFLLTSLTFRPFRVNLKMDAELVGEYRDKYADVQPGFHMNKKYWNTVYFDNNTIPRKELLWMVDHSYNEVIKKLSGRAQQQLKQVL